MIDLRRLTALVHGESGHGKSWLTTTTPGPRLYIDVEGRADHLPSRPHHILWDPRSGPPPIQYPDGSPVHTETTVVVSVRDFPTFSQVYSHLAAGNHYFRSVSIDSLSELQERCKRMLVGSEQAKIQDWGDLLTKMEQIVLDYKDLRTHPTRPLDCLIVVSGTHMKDGLFRPMLQGGLSGRLAYKFDLVGFLQFQFDAQTNTAWRSMAIQPYGIGVAKDNTDTLSQVYGMNIINPNFTTMFNVLNGAQLETV